MQRMRCKDPCIGHSRGKLPARLQVRILSEEPFDIPYPRLAIPLPPGLFRYSAMRTRPLGNSSKGPFFAETTELLPSCNLLETARDRLICYLPDCAIGSHLGGPGV